MTLDLGAMEPHGTSEPRALDRLILDTADAESTGFASADAIVVCDDPSGALTAAAAATDAAVACIDSDYTRAHAAHGAGARVAGVDGPMSADEFLAAELGAKPGPFGTGIVAVGEMPKSLARLDYLARTVAGAAARNGMEATLVLGGNNKHLARSMNDTLAESFAEVGASRGRGKFRCLVATGPRDVTYAPRTADRLTAFGGVFSGPKEDYGGKLLADELLAAHAAHGVGRVLDLGCGNGSVVKRLREADVQVSATDADADAVLSTRMITDDVTWDDAGSRLPSGSFDTVALNPPFHDRAGVDATLVQHLLDASVRLLSPSGQLFMVHNSHLRYRGEVEARFDHVGEVARNSKFTVLRALRSQ